MRSILFVFLSLIAIALSLDCRKFSFAPACRGIMLKRSEGSESDQSSELEQWNQSMETVSWLLRQAEAEGIKDCIPTSWLRQKMTSSFSPNASQQ